MTMHEVTCFHCGHIVHITPDSERCSVCGEDLRHLIPLGYASGYFYERASRIADENDQAGALAEVERGLEYVNTPELRLLGAILAKRVGLYDRMRHHVTMIPVDDALRSEAEWLVRSHQDRQRALREGQREAQAAPLPVEQTEAPFSIEDFVEEEEEVPEPQRGIRRKVGILALAGVAVVLLIWFFFPPLSDGVTGLLQIMGPTVNATSETMAEPVDSSQSEAPTVESAPVDVPTPQVENAPILPTPTVSPNLVQEPTESSEIADRDPGSSVVQEPSIYDLRAYLIQIGRNDLADLDVHARIEGRRLILHGFVPFALYRIQLVEIAEQIPDVDEVSHVDLILSTPPTYVVQEGDTLWNIVFNLYGDVERINEFYRYNSDILPSANALSVGMELKVMPNE